MKKQKQFKHKAKLNSKDKLRIIKDNITDRNEQFEKYCLLSQPELKQLMTLRLAGYGEIQVGDGYVYKAGDIPILLVAHMDTVHMELPREIVYANGTISSPQGIGGDDRCGIYMIMKILEKHNCHVLLCEDEEIGCKGSGKFCKTPLAKELEGKFQYLIQMDRKGSTDAVFYECDNPEFEEFITKEYWKLDYGSFTDIVELAPVLKAAAVNFSCGYYKAHTKDEYVVLSEMEKCIEEIVKLIDRTTETDKYEYIEAVHQYKNWFSTGSSRIGAGWEKERWYICYMDELTATIMTEEIEADTFEEAVGIFLINHGDMCFADIYDVWNEDQYYEYLYGDLEEEDVYKTYGLTK